MDRYRSLVSALQAAPALALEVLSDELKRSEQQILVDIEWLRGTGLAISIGPGRQVALHTPVTLLSEQLLSCQLNESTERLMTALHIEDVIDSTSDFLKTLPEQKQQAGRVCLAEYQLAGRGRHGRQWQSAYGCGLCLSLIWSVPATAGKLSGLPLGIAVAVSRFLSELGLFKHQLKWPNDVLVKGDKLAGILVEVLDTRADLTRVVVGIGMNVNQPDPVHQTVARPMVDLHTCLPDNTLDRSQLAGLLIHHLLQVLHQFTHSGFEDLRHEWQQRDALRGQHVRLTSGNDVIEGRASGISSSGQLKLETASGLVELSGGEVSIVRTEQS